MYQALYRKYRSRTFDEVVGQDQVINSIKYQVKNSTVSHAYIFSGTRGTGKTSTAKILARAVNCEHPIDGNPCNECETCKSILRGTNLDVVEMDAASNNGVDDIRDLREKAFYPPSTSKYKVYIIDEVHMLSKGAFNALLKILEEPPKHLIFILATTEIERVPQTILSRTQRYTFKRISIDTISKNISEILAKEGKTIDEAGIDLIAQMADGSMRDAVSLLDRVVAINDNNISYDKIIEVLGVTTEDTLFELATSILNSDASSIIMSVANLADDGKDMMVLIDGIVSFFRNILIAKNLSDPRKIIRVRDMDRYVAIANAFSNSEILNIIKILSETKARSRYITNKRTMLEAALLEIVASKQDDILNRVENLERMLSSGDLSGLKAPKREKFEFNFAKKENPVAVEKPLAKEVVSEIIDNKVSNETKENVEKEIENDIPKDIPEVPVDDHSDMSAIEKSQEDAAETDINAVETEETMETKADIDYSDNELQGIFNRAISILKERSERIISGMLVMGRLDSFENNVATIAFEEQGRSFYTTLNNHESIEKIESVLKELTNDNISVKFVVKSNSNVDSIKDRIENLFGKDSIK
ncbi:DNA polymerase III subunit gamma/tau [Peptoniphilus sp. BV3AC2]|uniref:DNA polymerase III subunit gamma/tau n=1 Tax=Peptoniphilus sp. BV3AC2 TaxID=1111133 RepID=UPI0003B87ADA|nr:DNA polymerase III subunit gamma/tau [Peptoniphilus sp. BV3AC2]ERT62902.1 DNA polymerase III, subunit gamma and tau-like protein [Peptoniphilus sp. BV3AC2]